MVALQSATRRILLLAPGDARARWIEDLARSSGAELLRADSLAYAVQILSGSSIDAIISLTGDFLALERAAVSQQAGRVLDVVGAGLAVMDGSGNVLWQNHACQRLPQAVFEQVGPQVAPFIEECNEQLAANQSPQSRLIHVPNAEAYFDIRLSAVVEDGRVQRVAVLIQDATSELRLRQKLDAIDAAGQALVCFERDDTLTVPARLELLESRILGLVRDVLRYDKFCIRMLDRDNILNLLCSVGFSDPGKLLKLRAAPEGNGICGYVAATGRSYICPDTAKDPRYLVGIDHARSSLTVPLRLRDQLVGVFNIESERPYAFSEDDRQFAEIFGRYIALSLDVLQLIVFERKSTSGQIAADVAKQLASPLNDVQVETQSLIEDYLGNDELRSRLHAIQRSVNEMRILLRNAADLNADLAHGARQNVETDPLLNGRTVLVADDNDLLRETIADILSKYGCELQVAQNGNEAAELIAVQTFDLVLSDIKMPGQNGYELFALARARNPATRVILMTGFGYDPNHCIVKASSEGLDGILFKPFKTQQLIDTVHAALTPRSA